MGRKAIDLTGQTFGMLTVLRRGENAKDGHAKWICQCACENHTIIEVNSNQLKKGNTKSCGCLRGKNEKYYKDLTNQKFGKLTAKEMVGSASKSKLWRCECDCGNKEFFTTAHHLLSGNTKSCGCLKSTGELNIQNLLIENQIHFEREKIFKDLGLYRFDFYLPKYNRLIEFDGEQHFKQNIFFDNLEEIQKRDQEKNEWAKENNVPLVRIPYWERDNITLDMILGDKYLVC